ncbi:MAG TPA: hypothetical protein VGD01_09425 [Candidatus Elarobacter sp.]
MLYSQEVLAVLVRDRQRAITQDLARSRRARLRQKAASAVYALAKAVTVVAVALDDDPVYAAVRRG